MSLKIFIAGTDTDVGKTYVAAALLRLFSKLGYSTLGIKPIASDCHYHNNILLNNDALTLHAASSIKLAYKQINPFSFKSAIAPHIAAKAVNIKLSAQALRESCASAFCYPADVHIIEGAGGWYVPLNQTETMADFVIALQLPVILVVGMKLGCLNHALLTYQAMQHTHVVLIGWVANCIETMESCTENIQTLQDYLNVPCLGVIPYQHLPDSKLDVTHLLSFFA
jgi:dethiobiotin synthetase